ncbi:4194_t:CDS:2, partial [Diversispora eburnea]
VVESNKYPLKISLIRIPQEIPSEVKDYIIVKILVTDYVDQDQTYDYYQNIAENSKDKLEHDTLPSISSNNFMNRSKFLSLKHIWDNNFDRSIKGLVNVEIIDREFQVVE